MLFIQFIYFSKNHIEEYGESSDESSEASFQGDGNGSLKDLHPLGFSLNYLYCNKVSLRLSFLCQVLLKVFLWLILWKEVLQINEKGHACLESSYNRCKTKTDKWEDAYCDFSIPLPLIFKKQQIPLMKKIQCLHPACKLKTSSF